MALSGNLGFVPLDEVLRLLARSDQQGSVDVRGDDVQGRIFLSRRGIDLATTSDDATLKRHLVNSGYVDEPFLSRVERGEASFGSLGDGNSQAIVALLREMTVEGLYQLDKYGETFEVLAGETTAYAAPEAFDLEDVLADAGKRSEEWAEIGKSLSDLDGVIKMTRDLGDRERVEITNHGWRVLSEIGSGASVNTLADRLGTTEFWTANVASELAARSLLVVPAEAPTAAADEPVEDVEFAYDQPRPRVGDDVDPDESWWVDPEAEEGIEVASPAEDATEPEVPAAEAADEPETSDEDIAAADDDAVFVSDPAFESGHESVEEDTEAFLEKVFSELDNGGEAEEEGHGLLRRRRMGSVLRELSDED